MYDEPARGRKGIGSVPSRAIGIFTSHLAWRWTSWSCHIPRRLNNEWRSCINQSICRICRTGFTIAIRRFSDKYWYEFLVNDWDDNNFVNGDNDDNGDNFDNGDNGDNDDNGDCRFSNDRDDNNNNDIYRQRTCYGDDVGPHALIRVGDAIPDKPR